MKIPLAHDRRYDDAPDATDDAPCPQPQDDDEHGEPVGVWPDVPYVRVFAAEGQAQTVSCRRPSLPRGDLRMTIVPDQQQAEEQREVREAEQEQRSQEEWVHDEQRGMLEKEAGRELRT